MIYTAEDVQVLDDPVAFIRNHPQMFVERVSGVELALKLVRGILLLTSAPVTVSRHGDWWTVASEVDWLTAPGSASADEVFYRMLPFPQAGANSIRPEVLVTTFATDVATWDRQGVRVLKGEAPAPDEIRQAMAAHPHWQRGVAFRLGS